MRMQQPVTSNRQPFNRRFDDLWRAVLWLALTRLSLWGSLSRDARHPVATHLRRQVGRARQLPLLKLSLAYGMLLLIFGAYVYVHVEHVIMWLLPFWLMLFSTFYCAIWIGRIVPLMSRQSILGVLDEISMIPPGRVFIYLTICKVVLNRDDAVVWLGLLRRVMAGAVLIVLVMSLCIALSLLSDNTLLEVASILADLVLAAAVIVLEHSQSTVIACLIAIEIANRLGGHADRTSVAVAAFVFVQILCYALVLAVVIALDTLILGLALFLFLLIREMLVSALWRLILHGANEDGARMFSGKWRQIVDVDSAFGAVN